MCIRRLHSYLARQIKFQGRARDKIRKTPKEREREREREREGANQNHSPIKRLKNSHLQKCGSIVQIASVPSQKNRHGDKRANVADSATIFPSVRGRPKQRKGGEATWWRQRWCSPRRGCLPRQLVCILRASRRQEAPAASKQAARPRPINAATIC
jgi:hypothetical protein